MIHMYVRDQNSTVIHLYSGLPLLLSFLNIHSAVLICLIISARINREPQNASKCQLMKMHD